jgi:hypothetical protein
MPAVSKRQQRFMAWQYAQKKAGKGTRTGMSLNQLHDFMSLKRGAPECAVPGCGKKHARGEHRE